MKTFPPEEKFALALQMRRSAISSTANIAEGFGRFHYQDNIRFCRVSRGSLYETMDHMITCYDEEYLNKEQFVKFIPYANWQQKYLMAIFAG